LFHDGWHKLKIVHDGHKSIVSCIIFLHYAETNIANPPKPISPVIARTSLSLNHNDRLQ
jgi:hypothetical protein